MDAVPLDTTDDALIKAALQNPEAFGELVTRYQDRIFNYVYRMTGSREDAEDLAQETFVRAYTALASFRQGAPFAPWLYRIATNLSINFIKRRKRQGALALEFEVEDKKPSVEALVESRETKQELEQAILELPEEFRAALLLRHLYQLSYDEMADALDIPLGTVKTRLFRARESLRKKLKEYHTTESHGLREDNRAS